MKVQVVTTITTLIDVDTLEPTHAVVVASEEGVSEKVARAVAIGACRTVVSSLEAGMKE